MATAWRWLLKLKTFGYSGGTDPDDPVSQADLEEGEIIDSGQEDSDDQPAKGKQSPLSLSSKKILVFHIFLLVL